MNENWTKSIPLGISPNLESDKVIGQLQSENRALKLKLTEMQRVIDDLRNRATPDN